MAKAYVRERKGGRSPLQHQPTDMARVAVQADTPEERIGAKVAVTASGCWEYDGYKPSGYGRYSGKSVHRFVYETLVGPIPAGYHVHHKCENRACCNPEHLAALTPLEHKAAHRGK